MAVVLQKPNIYNNKKTWKLKYVQSVIKLKVLIVIANINTNLKRMELKWSQKSRDKLTDSYVIGQITKRSSLTAEIVKKHPELIEVKKIIIKTKRLCKTSQN